MVKLTKKSFKEAVENSLGTKTQISSYIGCTFQAVHNYCEKHKEFTEPLLIEARKRNVSHSSDNLYSISKMEITDHKGEIIPALVRHKLKANETILKTQGKDEGWGESKEVNLKVENALSKEEKEKEIKRLLSR